MSYLYIFLVYWAISSLISIQAIKQSKFYSIHLVLSVMLVSPIVIPLFLIISILEKLDPLTGDAIKDAGRENNLLHSATLILMLLSVHIAMGVYEYDVFRHSDSSKISLASNVMPPK